MRVALWFAALLLLLYAGACLLLFLLQRSLLYFPQPRAPMSAAATASLPVDGAELVLTVRPQGGPKALIYFGGNAEDVSGSLPDLAAAFPDRSLYLMHYRGYGGSTGRPSEAALHADAAPLFDVVQPRHGDVLVVGRSLGSGVAVQLAARRPVSALVLVTPYDSIRGIAAQQFPMFPVRWLLRDTFDSGAHAPRVQAPTVLVVAGEDEVIPAWSSQQLHARFRPGIAEYRSIRGAGHNSISAHAGYASALRP